MLEPYLSTQGCCGTILFTVQLHNFRVLGTVAACEGTVPQCVVGRHLGSSLLVMVVLVGVRQIVPRSVA